MLSDSILLFVFEKDDNSISSQTVVKDPSTCRTT